MENLIVEILNNKKELPAIFGKLDVRENEPDVSSISKKISIDKYRTKKYRNDAFFKPISKVLDGKS